MRRKPLLALVAGIAGASCVTPALAGGHPTIRDRIERVVATFMGDPAADVDYDMKHVLDAWRGLKPKPLERLTADDARRQPTPIEAANQLLRAQGKPLDRYTITTKDVTFPGPGADINAKIYVPAGSGVDVPVVIFYHGGGFVLENAASTVASSRAIAGEGEFIVVAPEYRLAPEHKLPAQQDDALAVYKWVLANAGSFGGSADRIAFAGEGAGAMLAADTAIAVREQGLKTPAALVMIAPAAGTNLTTNSWIEDSAARPWNREAVQWAMDLFLPNKEWTHDPRIDLVGHANVDGLPPTTIVTAEIDPLRSDGERFGSKLKRATVPVAMRDYPGVIHDFFGMGGAVEQAALAERFVAEQLRKAFNPATGKAVTALTELGIDPSYEQAAFKAPKTGK